MDFILFLGGVALHLNKENNMFHFPKVLCNFSVSQLCISYSPEGLIEPFIFWNEATNKLLDPY